MSASQSINFPLRNNSGPTGTPGELLQKYRLQTGLTQTQLAQAIGLKSLRMIQYWEAGNSLPKADNLKKLIEVFAGHQGFEPGQVRAGIEQLWAVVKEEYDGQGSASGTPYPELALPWLDKVTGPDNAAPAPTRKPASTPQVVPFTPRTIPGNLPLSQNSFVGRKKELEEISACLGEGRTHLLTLLGPGGAGKTRLSLEVARHLRDIFPQQYPDGVWLAELAATSDPQLVNQLVAKTLWPEGQSSGEVLGSLVTHLGNKRLLLVLDNCEHVIEACAVLVETLLGGCPNLQIITTSREPLNLPGEFVWTLGGLSLPARARRDQGEDEEGSEAVEFFVTRVRAFDPGFNPNPANRASLAQLCQMLDGLPLALELAAARMKSLGLQQIVSRLQQNFKLLAGGNRTSAPRHQTVQALLDWSYYLLQSKEQMLLRGLAVFRGSFGLEDAEAVVAGDYAQGQLDDFEILDLLSQLVNKSLVVAETGDGVAETRYHLLEMVRQYGLEKLEGEGETAYFKLKHCLYFLKLGEKAEVEFKGPNQGEWLDRLERDNDNLRAALGWGLDGANPLTPDRLAEQSSRLAKLDKRTPAELALALSGAIWRFWFMRGYYTEGQHWLERTLASVKPDESRENKVAQAKALRGRGVMAYLQADYPPAQAALEKGLALYKELDMKAEAANVLNDLGMIRWAQGEYEPTVALWSESLAMMREVGHQAGIANQLNNLGTVAMYQGDYTRALSYYTESGQSYRRLGEDYGLANSLLNQGEIWRNLRDFKQSLRLLKESLALFRKIGFKKGISNALNNLANAALEVHDYTGALHWAEESYKEADEIGDTFMGSYSLHTLGIVWMQQGENSKALEIFRQSLALRRDFNDKTGLSQNLQGLAEVSAYLGDWTNFVRLNEYTQLLRQEQNLSYNETEQTALANLSEKALKILGADTFEKLSQEGRAYTQEEVINYALHFDPEAARTPLYQPEEFSLEADLLEKAGLTRREIEVLALLGQGLTNNQMADKLVISPHTVNRHLTNIYSKLDLTTRTEAVRFALQNQK